MTDEIQAFTCVIIKWFYNTFIYKFYNILYLVVMYYRNIFL